MMYRENGDTITIEMTRGDYEYLLWLLGVAGGIRAVDPRRFWETVDFVNRLNAGNPRFRQYDLPEEFRRP